MSSEPAITPDPLYRAGKSPSDVGIWRIDLLNGAPPAERIECLLDPSERSRAARFVRDDDRTAFIRSHAALRLVLAKAIQHPPQSIGICGEPMNKPQVDRELLNGIRLDFSLSHSGGVALIGIARDGGRIGVDVETRPASPDFLDIARRWFAREEIKWLTRQGEDEQGFLFLQCWTRKEAFLKATGDGLSGDLCAYRCQLHSDGSVGGSVFDANDRVLPEWRTIPLDERPIAACAVVDFEPTNVSLEAFDWASDVC